MFWDITSCSPLKVIRRFRGTYRVHLQGRIIRRTRNQRERRWQAELTYSRFILRSRRWRRYVPPKRRSTFNGLHGLISQKILFLVLYQPRCFTKRYSSYNRVIAFPTFRHLLRHFHLPKRIHVGKCTIQ
jgi:hypothetical protein